MNPLAFIIPLCPAFFYDLIQIGEKGFPALFLLKLPAHGFGQVPRAFNLRILQRIRPAAELP
jgi:hypothetical protein